MFKLKSKLIIAVIVILGITAFMSCGKEATLKTNNLSSVPKLADDQIEYIGKMHNVFVKRAYDDYFVKLKTRSSNSNVVILDIMDLISFFEQQPESKDINISDIEKIKEFYYNFKTDENSNVSYSEQLLEYLKLNVEEMYGIDYNEIINPTNTRSVLKSKTNNTLTSVAFSVNKNSEMFWREYHGYESLRAAPGSATIAADTGGSLWGLFFGPIGSIIAGGVASIVANEIEQADGNSPVFDGKVHSPKMM